MGLSKPTQLASEKVRFFTLLSAVIPQWQEGKVSMGIWKMKKTNG